jgi:hypothetical protein
LTSALSREEGDNSDAARKIDRQTTHTTRSPLSPISVRQVNEYNSITGKQSGWRFHCDCSGGTRRKGGGKLKKEGKCKPFIFSYSVGRVFD